MSVEIRGRESQTARTIVVWLATAAIVTLQWLLVYKEMHFGRLAGLILWDDNGIINRALTHLERISGSSSLLDLLRHWKVFSFHAPVADIQAALGLLIFQGNLFGPYFLSFLWVVGALVVTLRNIETKSFITDASVALVLISQTLESHVLVGVKSDLKAVIFMACAVLLLSEWARVPVRKKGIAAAALLAIALLCKLTAFYLPIFAIFTILLFHMARHTASFSVSTRLWWSFSNVSKTFATEFRFITIMIAVAVFPFALMFAWAARRGRILRYIMDALGETWVDGLTFVERGLFYLPGGNPLWGNLPYLLIIIIPVFVILSLRSRDYLGVAILVAAAISALMYLSPLIVAKTSNPEFGSYFYGMWLGTALVCVVGISNQSIKWAIATMGFCILFVINASWASWSDQFAVEDLRLSKRTYERIVDRIISLEKTDRPRVTVTFEDGIAGFPNISLLHFLKAGVTTTVNRLDVIDDQATFLDTMDRADFVLTLEPLSPDIKAGYQVIDRFPASRKLAVVDDLVAALPGMTKVGSYDWKNGRLNLYANTAVR